MCEDEEGRPPNAIVMDRYGPPRVLQYRQNRLPSLGQGEVRLRTIASAVNRADVEIRSGNWPVQQERPFPYVPGIETLGTVVDIGPGVRAPSRGVRVITMMQRLGGIHGERPGGYAEYVTVPAAAVAPIPDDIDPYDIAALGLAAVTATEGLRRLRLDPGDRLVVHGAAGGVGSVAVSIGVQSGADVVAVVNRPEQLDYVRSLGAEEAVVLDRSAAIDALPPRSVDAVFETLGARTFKRSVATLRPGGRLCLVGALTGADLELEAWDLMQDLHLTGYSSENLSGDDLRRDMDDIVAALRAGALPAPERRLLPLSAAAEAHRLIEAGGTRGRLLLIPAASIS